ncbi:MAG TPA: hypothetical protein VGF30_02675 [Bacteroidia bacterium]
MEKENIDIFIKRSLESVESEPAVSSFEATMKKLDAGKKKRRRVLFLWWFVGFILVGSIGFSIFNFGNDQQQVILTKTSGRKVKPVTSMEKEGSNDVVGKSANEPTVKTELSNFSETQKAGSARPVSLTDKEEIRRKSKERHYATITKELSSADTSVNISITESENADFVYLDLIKNPFSNSITDPGLKNTEIRLISDTLPSTPKETKPDNAFIWYVGPELNPQQVKYSVSKNDQRDSKYDGNASKSLADFYTDMRNKDNRAVSAWNASVKGGFMYKRKWTVEASLGYQQYHYSEQEFRLDSSFTPSITTSLFPASASTSYSVKATTYKSVFRYLDYSVGASYMVTNPAYKLKIGLCFTGSNLVSANTVIVEDHNSSAYRTKTKAAPVSKWIYGSALHINYVEQLSNGIQLYIGPNVFYRFNSMFSKSYLITQKPYGFGVNLGVLFRLR